MPSAETWNLKMAIDSFITFKKRKDSSNIIERKPTCVPYFKGVFPTLGQEEDCSVSKPINVTKKF